MMQGTASEYQVTHMGDVPDGMTFLEASWALKPKYEINPGHHSKRLTICETSREIWRIADQIGNEDLKLLAKHAFSYGKSMDSRLKYLRSKLDEAGVEY